MQNQASVLEALRVAYLKVDQETKDRKETSGSTAVSAIVTVNPEGKRVLYTANAGDARIILW